MNLRRIFSLIMALLMVVSALPMNVLAEEVVTIVQNYEAAQLAAQEETQQETAVEEEGPVADLQFLNELLIVQEEEELPPSDVEESTEPGTESQTPVDSAAQIPAEDETVVENEGGAVEQTTMMQALATLSEETDPEVAAVQAMIDALDTTTPITSEEQAIALEDAMVAAADAAAELYTEQSDQLNWDNYVVAQAMLDEYWNTDSSTDALLGTWNKNGTYLDFIE